MHGERRGDPHIRTTKAVDALRPGGLLAVISTQHVAGGIETFFIDAQTCNDRSDLSTPPDLRCKRPTMCRLTAASSAPQDDSPERRRTAGRAV